MSESSAREAPEVPEVPEDVTTGFWLWAIALPLMLVGFVVASVAAPSPTPDWLVNATTAVLTVTVGATAAAFLMLLRHGYRWARTLLTGGGAASVVYAVTTLFQFATPASGGSGVPGGVPSSLWTMVLAVTTIVGSVCIGGGIFLLHRKPAHEFFTR